MAAILRENGAQQKTRIHDEESAIENVKYPENVPDFATHSKEIIDENQNNIEEGNFIIDPRLEVDP